MTKFQIIILSIFAVFLVGGVVAFATFKGKDSTSSYSPIVIWGTFPAEQFDTYTSKVNNTLAQRIQVTYVQKKVDEFSRDFIAALARGMGPDVILVPADTLLAHQDKLALIPYTALPQRDFLNTYIGEANIYLSSGGSLGIPFTVDPLMMYWNRDTFDAAGIATYPRYWDEFAALNKKLTIKDQNGNVRKSALALGEFSNVTNAREIFATLLLQTDNPITAIDSQGMIYSTLKNTADVSPADALSFFTQFVDPADPMYSWNKSLPESKTAFLSGTLATYFGFASELSDLRTKNPNINFDAALLPQREKSTVAPVTYGKMYGFSIVRTAPDLDSAYQIISILTSPSYLADFSNSLYLPSVRRDVIAQGSVDPYITIFNQAALISKTWLDVDPVQSRSIFRSMVESYTSGQKRLDEALRDAGDQYDIVLEQALK